MRWGEGCGLRVFGGGIGGGWDFISELDLFAAEVSVLAGDFGGTEAGEGFDEGDELVEVGGVGGLEEFEDLGGDQREGALDEVGGIGGCQGVGAPTPYRLESEGGEFFEALGLGVLLGVVAEAALSPGGEVAVGDGLVGEEFVEDLLDLGQFVEPGEDLGAGLAVAEALVELGADGLGEAGDFAGAGAVGGLVGIHKYKILFGVECDRFLGGASSRRVHLVQLVQQLLKISEESGRRSTAALPGLGRGRAAACFVETFLNGLARRGSMKHGPL